MPDRSIPIPDEAVYYLWRCPIDDCGNLHVHGRDDDRAPGVTPTCMGSDAPGFDGSHDPVRMERLDLVALEDAPKLYEAWAEDFASKLDELRLHDETGDPRDEGYMAALADVAAALDLREWEGN